MSKLIYSFLASLDGYIADDAGTFDWAVPLAQPRVGVHAAHATRTQLRPWPHSTDQGRGGPRPQRLRCRRSGLGMARRLDRRMPHLRRTDARRGRQADVPRRPSPTTRAARRAPLRERHGLPSLRREAVSSLGAGDPRSGRPSACGTVCGLRRVQVALWNGQGLIDADSCLQSGCQDGVVTAPPPGVRGGCLMSVPAPGARTSTSIMSRAMTPKRHGTPRRKSDCSSRSGSTPVLTVLDLGAGTRPLNDSTSGHCQWIKDGWAVGYRFEP